MFVYRDPIARQTLMRERHYTHRATCAWCGQTNATSKGRTYIYTYAWLTDAGRTHPVRSAFCSTSCFRSYTR